jgi:23S rRNA (uracil1939-C5)-methyltransferase
LRARGELAELEVERIGAQGDGIATWRAEPVYIPFTSPGERVRARLGMRRGGGREGRVVERLPPEIRRAAPKCPHFGRCGGCALQHLEPALYASVKRGFLEEALRRVGIDPSIVEPLLRVSPLRRRVRVGLMRPRAAYLPARAGFRERFRHELVDVEDCAVVEPALLALVRRLRGTASALIEPGEAANASLCRTDSGIDLLFEALPRPSLPALEALAQLAEERDLARIVWRAGDEPVPVVERRPVRVNFSGVTVAVPPGAFLQASEEAERLLVAEVVAGIGARRPALDLYAGLGTFAFALARSGPVHAVEGDAEASAALAAAAAAVEGVTVERRDLARDPLPPEALARYAAAVFDPPRAGAMGQAAALAASSLETVVAVSCNSATFARDARILLDGGFRLARVQPIDQFVWSPHLEIAALFTR